MYLCVPAAFCAAHCRYVKRLYCGQRLLHEGQRASALARSLPLSGPLYASVFCNCRPSFVVVVRGHLVPLRVTARLVLLGTFGGSGVSLETGVPDISPHQCLAIKEQLKCVQRLLYVFIHVVESYSNVLTAYLNAVKRLSDASCCFQAQFKCLQIKCRHF